MDKRDRIILGMIFSLTVLNLGITLFGVGLQMGALVFIYLVLTGMTFVVIHYVFGGGK